MHVEVCTTASAAWAVRCHLTTRGSQRLNEIWSKLLAKYMPSIDAEARKLWSRFSALRHSGIPMIEHVNDCMTVRNLLEAIGEIVPDKQFVDKLLNVDRELSYLRLMLVRAPIAEIVAGLTDGYSYHYQDRQHQNHSGNAGRGRFQRRHPRGQGAPAAEAGPPAMAGVNAVSGGEERACENCNKIGHLREDCPKLHQEVRQYLKKHAVAARGIGRGRARGRGRGGQGVAAISVAEVQSMMDSLSGAESVFLLDKWLIDSGSDINICYNDELFSYIGPSDIEQCKFFDCEQEVDNTGSPVLVFNLGKDRPIMRSHPGDDGRVWTDVTDVLKNDTAIREIAAVRQAEGMDYVSTAFLAHLAYGHCGDAAMRLIAKASELYGGALSTGQAVGLRVDCEGCQFAGNIKRNQGLHQGRLVGQATAPEQSLHADVAGPIVPMGIGQAKYVLVAVDQLTRYTWVFPMRKKPQKARLLAILIQRINTQVR